MFGKKKKKGLFNKSGNEMFKEVMTDAAISVGTTMVTTFVLGKIEKMANKKEQQ